MTATNTAANTAAYSAESLTEILRPEAYMTNFFIANYLSELEQRNRLHLAMAASWQVRSSQPKIVAITPFFSEIACASVGYQHERVRDLYQNQDIFSADVIIIPALVKTRMHWALVVVDMVAKQIRWYDWDRSHLIQDDSFTQTVQQWLYEEAIAKRVPDAADYENFTIVKAYDGPPTCADGECGPLTLLVATLIAEGIPVSEAAKEDALKNFRVKIADMMLGKSIY